MECVYVCVCLCVSICAAVGLHQMLSNALRMVWVGQTSVGGPRVLRCAELASPAHLLVVACECVCCQLAPHYTHVALAACAEGLVGLYMQQQRVPQQGRGTHET